MYIQRFHLFFCFFQHILKNALDNGKTVYIPRYFLGGNHMEMVKLYDMDDYESLPLTKWNIRQPKDDEERPEALLEKSLDLILVPGTGCIHMLH